jgi:predicted HicB family RNase H-like nuclease
VRSADGYSAKIEYDVGTDLFRGEILGLSGGADFYGANPDELRLEFKRSLDVFLEVCREKGIGHQIPKAVLWQVQSADSTRSS